jgi:hypothetical protein
MERVLRLLLPSLADEREVINLLVPSEAHDKRVAERKKIGAICFEVGRASLVP